MGWRDWFGGKEKTSSDSGVKVIGTTRTKEYELSLKRGSAAIARKILEENKYPIIDAGTYGDGTKDIIHFMATDKKDLTNARLLLSNFLRP